MKKYCFVLINLLTINFIIAQKEDFSKKGITFFIHKHKYFEKELSDSLSFEANKPKKRGKSITKKDSASITISIQPLRFAYFDKRSIEYFRVNPKEYISFSVNNLKDSVFNEDNFSNIIKVSRDSLMTTVFRIYDFKTIDYRFKKRYKDYSRNYVLKKVNLENRKKIMGFSCYEVILESDYKILKMFVTDEIMLNYHPVINDIKILQKYYPLHIIFMDKKFPKRNFTEFRFTKGRFNF